MLRIHRALLGGAMLIAGAVSLQATTVIPISDIELQRRADVVVHGTVRQNTVIEGSLGHPETVTVISPIEVLKGELIGDLILHQVGGELPDGRSFKMYGRPEYVVGQDVVVFAIARPEGNYQTAELVLGKYEVWQDSKGELFAVPDLDRGVHDGVVVYRGLEPPSASGSRLLNRFTEYIRRNGPPAFELRAKPEGNLTPFLRGVPPPRRPQIRSDWGNLNNNRIRWNNGATAVWTRSGTALMTGGGNAEAIAAVNAWTNQPLSTINFTDGSGSSNIINLNAATSPCGWNTCVPGTGGTVGCGGPSTSGSHTHRGETYSTAVGGNVWLRCFSSNNQFSSGLTQAILLHELGHALGLGHSDTNVSANDACRGDEASAIMSSVISVLSFGTDDIDASRWLYGDGNNHCTAVTPPPTITSIAPTSGIATGGVSVTITGTNFVAGTTVTVGATPATVLGSTSTTLTFSTPALAAGALHNVVVTTPGGSATRTNGYMSDFLDVPQSYLFHSFVEKIFRNGITTGCAPGYYCPGSTTLRSQMAIFLLRGKYGASYAPPAATGTMFTDVSPMSFGAAFIERLAVEGITDGCAVGLFCPTGNVLRSQMAVFLLRSKYGGAYVPPAPTGTMFSDVPLGAFGSPFIERLAVEGITSGCAAGLYCPNSSTTRGEMAVFISRTFNLP